MRKRLFGLLVVILIFTCLATAQQEDSLPPLKDGKVPCNLDELWGKYDPRKEPLEAGTVKEWKEGEITCRFVLYTVGTFKGKKARMLIYYAFPKSDRKLPAIMHLHGGGQSASLDEVIYAARNGYAGISLNWGGNKRLDNWKESDPNTDWGALDCTHPPQHNKNNHFIEITPDEYTLDPVESPRNSNWFLVNLAARRGITFLEQQPEVDPKRIGVHGHSMGGRLTTEIAGSDKRVKAAVASCGGSGCSPKVLLAIPGTGLPKRPPAMELTTIDTIAYIPGITCPILVLSPTCDFHGHMDNFFINFKSISSRNVGYSITPHMNHHHTPEFAVCDMLWFEANLKDVFAFPKTPALTVKLATADGIPMAAVKPDRPGEAKTVDIYYSIDPHTLTRFWRHAPARREGKSWVASLPVMTLTQPLYVYANVSYPLTRPVIMRRGDTAPADYSISSEEKFYLPEELTKANVKATDTSSPLIDDFSRGFQDWYQLNERNSTVWEAWTRKLKDPKWRGPEGAKLMMDVKSPESNTMVFTFICNQWNAFPGKPGGTYSVEKKLNGSPDWQTVSISLDELIPAKGKKGKDQDDKALTNWSSVTEFCIGGSGLVTRDGTDLKLGGQPWKGSREFRNLRWEGGLQVNGTLQGK